jgi:hypothetical protein
VTVRLLECKGQSAREAPGVSYLDDMAFGIRDQAIALARETLADDQCQAGLADLLDRPSFRAAFLRTLAFEAARALAANDQRVLAVYSYEAAPAHGTGDMNEAGASAQLLVLVTASSAALEAFVVALNRALSASLRGIAGAPFHLSEPLLDISIVTQQQVRQGVGLARLLSAIRPRPVRLWQRQV